MNQPGGDWTLQDSEKLGQAIRIDQDRVMGRMEMGIHTHTALQKRWQFSEEQLDPLTKSESRALASLIASDYCICLVQCLTSTAPC